MPDLWTEQFPLDPFPLMSGPAGAHAPPAISKGDRVLFHAVGYARLFAEAAVTGDAVFDPASRWAPRWPWLYACRVETWLPRITDGPRTTPLVPGKAMGSIQWGAQYAALGAEEYRLCLEALLAAPGAQRRAGKGAAPARPSEATLVASPGAGPKPVRHKRRHASASPKGPEWTGRPLDTDCHRPRRSGS